METQVSNRDNIRQELLNSRAHHYLNYIGNVALTVGLGFGAVDAIEGQGGNVTRDVVTGFALYGFTQWALRLSTACWTKIFERMDKTDGME